MTQTALPSPKPRSRHAGSAWYRFYAMFSDEFAEQVLVMAGIPPGAMVLDPWLGVGTTVAVASRSGFRSFGLDVNPVMTTVSLGRFVSWTDAHELISYLEDGSVNLLECDSDDPLLNWFHPVTASGIRSLERFFRSAFPVDRKPEASAFLFTALFETAKTFATGFRTKNPTWVKGSSSSQRPKVSALRVSRKLIELAKQKANLCPECNPIFRPEIKIGESRATGLRDGSVDLVLTSPPYCTRIDYAVSTRIELAVLGFKQNEVAKMRNQSMGTSTIREAVMELMEEWGRTCLNLLKAIRAHYSKASASYYFKTHVQYFSDLYESLVEINRCACPGGAVVIVVQDSYYKEIHTDLQRIVSEMAAGLGWKQTKRFDYQVQQSIRTLNSASKRYRTDSKAVESVLWFKTSLR